MRINTTRFLRNYQGKPVFKSKLDSSGVLVSTKEKLTLRDAISTAINTTPVDRNRPMTNEQKNKAYQISLKLWSKKEINLTIDDMAFIKERVSDVYNPLIVGRISDIFEGKT
jgi:hypothetical protein